MHRFTTLSREPTAPGVAREIEESQDRDGDDGMHVDGGRTRELATIQVARWASVIMKMIGFIRTDGCVKEAPVTFIRAARASVGTLPAAVRRAMDSAPPASRA